MLKGLFDPAKFKGGYDFAGANYGSRGADGKPVTKATPDPNPIDGPGGHHGTHVNITDGRYVYMRAPLTRENGPVYEYTLMPTHMRAMFSPE